MKNVKQFSTMATISFLWSWSTWFFLNVPKISWYHYNIFCYKYRYILCKYLKKCISYIFLKRINLYIWNLSSFIVLNAAITSIRSLFWKAKLSGLKFGAMTSMNNVHHVRDQTGIRRWITCQQTSKAFENVRKSSVPLLNIAKRWVSIRETYAEAMGVPETQSYARFYTISLMTLRHQ